MLVISKVTYNYSRYSIFTQECVFSSWCPCNNYRYQLKKKLYSWRWCMSINLPDWQLDLEVCLTRTNSTYSAHYLRFPWPRQDSFVVTQKNGFWKVSPLQCISASSSFSTFPLIQYLLWLLQGNLTPSGVFHCNWLATFPSHALAQDFVLHFNLFFQDDSPLNITHYTWNKTSWSFYDLQLCPKRGRAVMLCCYIA